MSDYKAITQEMFSAIAAGGDVDAAVDKYMAEDFVDYEEVPGMGNTRETPRLLFKMMQAAITDFHVDVHDLLQEGDKVVARVSFVGTHTGEFMGVPASGHQVTINAIDILEFRGEQCVAHWGVTDMADALAQMGAGPHT
ncbi:MAG: ester cyclase [Propionicimonas sp.]